ncbi:hypothetical protein CIHG_03956 [Coccidioides immitis H538.4]|uniref:Uncharacterized protein n=1 Tax=Coccidioides immitis H538.4 TaxID=396776 RepID=A0A0J8UFL7_COCIT|nr:hypothetical protein CIHG_03956 [Coccidioides immitis H538.4]
MIEKGQLESPTAADYLEDPDDIPIPCKGCGEILEEGKAFELGGLLLARIWATLS